MARAPEFHVRRAPASHANRSARSAVLGASVHGGVEAQERTREGQVVWRSALNRRKVELMSAWIEEQEGERGSRIGI